MPYATGLRLLAALCFFSCLTIILAPIALPLGIVFWKEAKQKEQARKRELQAQNVDPYR